MCRGRQRNDSQNRQSDADGWTIAAASAQAARPVAELVLCSLPERARRKKVDSVVADHEDHLLLFARRDDDAPVAGALLIEFQPGRVAVFWPPQLSDAAPADLRAALLRHGKALLAGRDVLLAQALLLLSEDEQRHAFRAAGFHHATDLAILRCEPAELAEARPAVAWQTEGYTTANHTRLVDVIGASYQDTLDCPQLNGLRDVDDVLAGYRATGRFDPARWLLVRDGTRDAGCLLLTTLDDGTCELLYVGLCPEFRGRGWGAQLVRYAQWLARQAGASGLELAVDAQNTPALAMYAEAGLHTVAQRALWVCYGDSLTPASASD